MRLNDSPKESAYTEYLCVCKKTKLLFALLVLPKKLSIALITFIYIHILKVYTYTFGVLYTQEERNVYEHTKYTHTPIIPYF
ncbi:hypothetical protein EON63_18045 [archaeon]|nr:MAG: hypothetical protein EON63_18045 [archaeon]